jgi:hypothetical protein
MASYGAIKKKDEVAANLIQLWAYLDHKDLWYGLFSGVSERCSLQEIIPRWFQEMVSTKDIRELLAFSMIEAREDVLVYSVHPVVHEWALQALGRERKAELSLLAVIVVGKAVLGSTQRECWIMKQRLMPHADYCCRWIESGEAGKYWQKGNESEVNESVIVFFAAVHMFGHP